MSEGHSVVLHCPYCAEEDLRPYLPEEPAGAEPVRGAWLCAGCRRVFAVRLVGISPVQTTSSVVGGQS